MYKAYRGTEEYSGEKLPGIYLGMLPAGNASKPVTKVKTQWFPPIRTLQGQNGSVPAALAVVSRGPILVQLLRFLHARR